MTQNYAIALLRSHEMNISILWREFFQVSEETTVVLFSILKSETKFFHGKPAPWRKPHRRRRRLAHEFRMILVAFSL